MAIERYKKMGDALKATGRPILFSICEWGPRSPWLWGKEVGGHMWRTSYDVQDIWDTPQNVQSPIGILTSIDVMRNLARFAGPGGWNDPDMLVVGLNNTGFIKGGGCTDTEYRTQMSIWCMLAAPLMMGCDIRNMNESTKAILLNKDIIDIDQDALGKQGSCIKRGDCIEVWTKPLTGNRIAVALLNRSSADRNTTVAWKEMDLKSGAKYNVYDVWKHAALTEADGTLSADLKPHECQVFVLSPAGIK